MAKNETVVESIVGDRVTVDINGMLRVGGVPVCRVFRDENGMVMLEIKDRMRPRNESRGGEFVYATMNSFVDALVGASNERGSNGR